MAAIMASRVARDMRFWCNAASRQQTRVFMAAIWSLLRNAYEAVRPFSPPAIGSHAGYMPPPLL
eukprot:3153037-Pyramimonas_sp.AAC.1